MNSSRNLQCNNRRNSWFFKDCRKNCKRNFRMNTVWVYANLRRNKKKLLEKFPNGLPKKLSHRMAKHQNRLREHFQRDTNKSNICLKKFFKVVIRKKILKHYQRNKQKHAGRLIEMFYVFSENIPDLSLGSSWAKGIPKELLSIIPNWLS